MKKFIKLGLLLTVFLLLILAANVQAQDTPVEQTTYKDWITDNPNAEADIKVVADYLNALVEGDIEKALTLLADEYTEVGPTVADTLNKEKVITGWEGNYLNHSNRKIEFANVTFRVLQGNPKGDWVTVWGTYSFTQQSKDINLVFQYTGKVTNGKIIAGVIYYDRLQVYQTLGYKLTPPE